MPLPFSAVPFLIIFVFLRMLLLYPPPSSILLLTLSSSTSYSSILLLVLPHILSSSLPLVFLLCLLLATSNFFLPSHLFICPHILSSSLHSAPPPISYFSSFSLSFVPAALSPSPPSTPMLFRSSMKDTPTDVEN